MKTKRLLMPLVMSCVIGLAAPSIGHADSNLLYSVLSRAETSECTPKLLGEMFVACSNVPDASLRDQVLRACGAGLLSIGRADAYKSKVRPRLSKSDDFEESLMAPCAKCAGKKQLMTQCQQCKGTGKCSAFRCIGGRIRSSGFNGAIEEHACSQCGGTGICGNCKGSGEVPGSCPQCKGRGSAFSADIASLTFKSLVTQARQSACSAGSAVSPSQGSRVMTGIGISTEVPTRRLREDRSPSGADDESAVPSQCKASDLQALGRIYTDIGDVGNVSSVPRLISHLNDSDGESRAMICRALGYLSDGRAAMPLISCLNDPDTLVRHAVIVALGELGDKRAFEPLVARYNHESGFGNQQDIVRVIGRLKGVPLGRLMGLLSDDHFKYSAVEALGYSGDPAAFDVLMKQLYLPSSRKESVITALGNLRDVRAFDPLKCLIENSDNNIPPLVRMSAVRALGKLQDPRAAPILFKFYISQQGYAGGSALGKGAFRAMGEASILFLMNNFTNGTSCAETKDILVAIGKPAVIPLIGCLKNQNNNVMNLAADALVRIGDETAVAPLIAYFGQLTEEELNEFENRVGTRHGVEISNPTLTALHQAKSDAKAMKERAHEKAEGVKAEAVMVSGKDAAARVQKSRLLRNYFLEAQYECALDRDNLTRLQWQNAVRSLWDRASPCKYSHLRILFVPIPRGIEYRVKDVSQEGAAFIVELKSTGRRIIASPYGEKFETHWENVLLEVPRDHADLVSLNKGDILVSDEWLQPMLISLGQQPHTYGHIYRSESECETLLLFNSGEGTL